MANWILPTASSRTFLIIHKRRNLIYYFVRIFSARISVFRRDWCDCASILFNVFGAHSRCAPKFVDKYKNCQLQRVDRASRAFPRPERRQSVNSKPLQNATLSTTIIVHRSAHEMPRNVCTMEMLSRNIGDRCWLPASLTTTA